MGGDESGQEITYKRCVGFPQYFVSDRGDVYSLIRGRFKKPSLLKKKARNIRYKHNLKKGQGLGFERVTLARLVYTTHIGPIPQGYTIDHINSVASDNSTCNLQLLTRSENARKAGRDGLMKVPKPNLSKYKREKSKLSQKDVDFIRSSPLRLVDLADMFGVCFQYISLLKRNKCWKN